MRTLEKNVKNIWGEKGETWLNQLPSIIKSLSKHWSLTNIKPVNNMNYNYVALATQNNNNAVVLKICCDEQLMTDEYKALKHFDGRGSIEVIDMNKDYNALLLEQAIPGHLLKKHHPIKIEDTIKIYADVVKSLSSSPLPKKNYTDVIKWCEAIDRIQSQPIKKNFIEKAKKLRSFLLDSAQHKYLCHGDLHLENIIQHGKTWVAIDPKGIIAEMAFEAAAFDLISKAEINNNQNVSSKIIDRVTTLAKTLSLDFDRLLSWIFLRVMISAQWFIEDNSDPNEMLTLANHIYPICR